MSTNLEEISMTIDHIASRWEQADKLILRKLFPLLAEGKPISPSLFAQVVEKDVDTAEKALQIGRADRDVYGRVIELFGVMLIPTPHRIMVEDVALFSCCALVSQMIPLLMGKNVTIESVDPVNNKVVRIKMSPSNIFSVDPKDSVATFVITNREEVLKDVRSAFCSHVRHCIDTETATNFIHLNPKRYIVGIDQLHEIAQRLQTIVWG
jgi:hypothetical protein